MKILEWIFGKTDPVETEIELPPVFENFNSTPDYVPSYLPSGSVFRPQNVYMSGSAYVISNGYNYLGNNGFVVAKTQPVDIHNGPRQRTCYYCGEEKESLLCSGCGGKKDA